MKRRMLAFAMLGVAMWSALPQDAAAFGAKRHSSSCDGCASPCGMAGGACGQQYTVSYVDQKVTAYKTETEMRDVKVMVTKWKDVQQEYKYWVNEPITVKQKIVVQETRTKQEAYKYTVMEMVPEKNIVKVCQYVPVSQDREFKVCDMVPVVTKQKRTVCETVCVPTVVTQTIMPSCGSPCSTSSYGRFGGLCKKKHSCASACSTDCCSPCAAPCPQTCQVTVMQRQVVTREIEVDVTTYNRVERTVVRKITVSQPVWSDKEVTVMKCVPKQMEGMRTVNFCIPVEKEIEVASCKQAERTGVRTVKQAYQVEETIKQAFCKVVPYETTVKVPVCTPCASPCASPCSTPCSSCASPCSTCGMSGGCGRHHGCCR